MGAWLKRWWQVIVLLLTFGVLTVGLIAGPAQVDSSLDFGSVPDWFEAIATSGALLVAAFAVRQEVADRHELRERDRRHNARKVEVSPGIGGKVGSDEKTASVVYRNTTEEFVYDLLLTLTAPDGSVLVTDHLEDLGPGEAATRVKRFVYDGGDSWVRWTMRWRDPDGVIWLRTHRNDVYRV